MTFGSLAPWLAWLVIGAAAAGATAAFLIRPRPSRLVVPSLLVWQKVLDERRDESFWDRVRWLVSLVATVLVALAIALAFSRPIPGASVASGGRVLIVLDSSWSMRADHPAGGTRWTQAVRETSSLVRAAGAREVALATTAEGVVEGPTADQARIRRALDRLAPSGGVDGAWPRVAGATDEHFITDGATARAAVPGASLHSVFTSAPNVAIIAFDVESTPGANDARLFVAAANHALEPQSVEITVTRSTEVVVRRTVRIPAGGTHREEVAVSSAGDPRFRARITAPNNALAIDDEAAVWLWSASSLAVGVVGTPSALPVMLAEDRTLKVSIVDRLQYAKAEADVWIFNQWLPPVPPSKPALVIDPPESSWFGTRTKPEIGPVWRSVENHPVLDGVDASLLRIASARAITRPGLETIVRSPAGAALVGVEDDGAMRYVALGFSLSDSNIATTPAFPVFAGNVVDWLGRPERGAERNPGPVVLPPGTARVIAPTGQTLPLVTLDGRTVTTLDLPGLYLAESTGAPRVLNVRLGDPRRSNLLVSSLPPDAATRRDAAASGTPWWIVAAVAALVMLVVEWMTWQRRITV